MNSGTLYRLLAVIDPQRIGAAQVALARSLIQEKKFVNYAVDGHYVIAIDGTPPCHGCEAPCSIGPIAPKKEIIATVKKIPARPSGAEVA